jgi:SAM-dependent methyltransferase
MDIQEKARVLRFHRDRLGSQGHEELGWRTLASQTRRFEALCRFGDISGCSVLDLGCGHGDLKPYLDARFKDITYLGVDFLPEFVQEARNRLGHLPDTAFVQADFLCADLPASDVVFCSGSLNYRCKDPHHPRQAIARMWEAARIGVAFNLLEISWFPDDELVGSHDSRQILSYCRELCPAAQLLTDYLPDDFTLLMRR